MNVLDRTVRWQIGQPQGSTIAHVSTNTTTIVRYTVSDVGAAVDFYTKHFGFEAVGSSSHAFAAVSRGKLRLLLSAESARRPMPHGSPPGSGDWNRIHFVCTDLDAEITRLNAEGISFRSDVVTGPRGKQILAQDPSGNLIELFQPVAP
jgi:catechol 2,3-dioxygenase-like lactoylglutathione lyase family enzyme